MEVPGVDELNPMTWAEAWDRAREHVTNVIALAVSIKRPEVRGLKKEG
jgi:hypothetical protein